MVVGDELQSIYGFRHADLDVFREQRRAVEESADAVAMELSGNFRSRPEVIGAVNAIGEKLLGDAFRPLRVGAPPRLAEPPGEGAAVELLLTARDGWDAEGIDLAPATDADTPPNHLAEARFVAARLRELAEGGVERGEMVVLLRAFTHLDAYEDSLERAGLRPYTIGGRGYWSQQQVADVCALLATIANPLDDQALFGALASPACGAAPDTLWLLRAAAGRRRHVWPALERAATVRPWFLVTHDVTRNRAARSLRAERLEEIPESELALLRDFARTIAGLRARAGRASPGRPDRRRDRRDRLRPGGPDAPLGRGPLRQRAQADAARRRVRGPRGPRPARPARLPRLAGRSRRRGGGGERDRGARRGADHDHSQRQGARVRRRRRPQPLAAAAGRLAPAAADPRPRGRGAAGRAAAAPPRRRLDQPLLARAALRGDPAARGGGGAAALPRRRDPGARAADPQRRGDAPARAGHAARNAGDRADRRRLRGRPRARFGDRDSRPASRARDSTRASSRRGSPCASTCPRRSGRPS